ncbi:hypothetical protein C8R42DRAFT_152939 [Lentinula raphanica]|nr:hypothetical protein C8R42DRAFT_152939 [Lentinula raphanica]
MLRPPTNALSITSVTMCNGGNCYHPSWPRGRRIFDVFRTSDREGTNITHIFFPIRFIPFKTRRQLNDPTHPEYVIAHEETEKDKRKLQSLLNYIHAHNGGEHRMNADLFEFAVMKDLHPLAEWRVY